MTCGWWRWMASSCGWRRPRAERRRRPGLPGAPSRRTRPGIMRRTAPLSACGPGSAAEGRLRHRTRLRRSLVGLRRAGKAVRQQFGPCRALAVTPAKPFLVIGLRLDRRGPTERARESSHAQPVTAASGSRRGRHVRAALCVSASSRWGVGSAWANRWVIGLARTALEQGGLCARRCRICGPPVLSRHGAAHRERAGSATADLWLFRLARRPSPAARRPRVVPLPDWQSGAPWRARKRRASGAASTARSADSGRGAHSAHGPVFTPGGGRAATPSLSSARAAGVPDSPAPAGGAPAARGGGAAPPARGARAGRLPHRAPSR